MSARTALKSSRKTIPGGDRSKDGAAKGTYIYTYIHIYIYIHTYICIHIYTYINMYQMARSGRAGYRSQDGAAPDRRRLPGRHPVRRRAAGGGIFSDSEQWLQRHLEAGSSWPSWPEAS